VSENPFLAQKHWSSVKALIGSVTKDRVSKLNKKALGEIKEEKAAWIALRSQVSTRIEQELPRRVVLTDLRLREVEQQAIKREAACRLQMAFKLDDNAADKVVLQLVKLTPAELKKRASSLQAPQRVAALQAPCTPQVPLLEAPPSRKTFSGSDRGVSLVHSSASCLLTPAELKKRESSLQAPQSVAALQAPCAPQGPLLEASRCRKTFLGSDGGASLVHSSASCPTEVLNQRAFMSWVSLFPFDVHYALLTNLSMADLCCWQSCSLAMFASGEKELWSRCKQFTFRRLEAKVSSKGRAVRIPFARRNIAAIKGLQIFSCPRLSLYFEQIDLSLVPALVFEDGTFLSILGKATKLQQLTLPRSGWSCTQTRSKAVKMFESRGCSVKLFEHEPQRPQKPLYD
jgi:hypothetical protein